MSTIYPAGAGTIGIALYNVGLTESSLATLTAQSSSGLIASDYAGLGGGARTALDLAGQLASNTTAQSNAAQAADVNQVAQTALGQIRTLVTSVSNQLLDVSTSTDTGLATVSASARDALGQVAQLLDTKVGDTYVFAGQDSRTPPIPDPSNVTSSAFYAAVQAAVANLPTAGASAVQTQVLAAAGPGATSPFSSTLEASNQPAEVDLGAGQVAQVSVLADRNTDAVSAGAGTTSTGSYIRDVLASFATLGSLAGASWSDPQTQSLVGLVQTTLGGAGDALDTDIGGLGVRQQTVTAAQTELSATSTALTAQLGGVEDADTAEVASKLSQANTQLQASYQIIADLDQLSLAKYL